jgi:type I restriction enzyme S subunit
MEVYIQMTDEELIQYCKNNNIEYLKKNKKIYTKKTLIRNIMKSKKIETQQSENIIIQDNTEPNIINKIVWTLEQNQDINQNYKEIRNNLCNVVKRCHQLLYSNHAIVGTKAQNDIMKLLTLKILQPQFSNKESQLYKKCEKLLENGDISKEHYDKYMSYCIDLNSLIKEPKIILSNWEFFIRRFLSKILKIIYDDEDIKFNNNDYNTVSKIITIINELNIDSTFIDAFSTSYGDIHEAFRVYGGGKGAKELGQFFTPRQLIHATFNGCGFNDVIKSYNNPTIYDPCMGTGGLLTRAYSNGNILPNNIYGCETEKDTIKFGECSILLTTKEFNSNIKKCDSLCNNPYLFNNKFDIIFTNPPFGTKMKYEELKNKFNDYKKVNFKDSLITFESIYPYKTNNGACLFIQNCMYMLKEKGTCVIVLPDGELFSGKTFSKFRKFMCDDVNIIKIIKVEGGAFEHTSIKISIIIFQKNGSTKNIEFMDINKECNEVKSCAIVNINNIINENYAFNLSNYVKKESNINTKFEMKKLGDVCEINQGNSLTKKDFIEGLYNVIGGGKIIGKHNIYNRDGNEFVLTRVGDININYINTPYYLTDNAFSIKSLNDNIKTQYIYYLLSTNKKYLEDLYIGVAQKVISKTSLNNLEIPIPSLEIQEKIVKDIENITKSIETIKLRITQLKDEAKLFMKFYKTQDLEELNKNVEMKKLGDVCDFQNGKGLNKSSFIDGEYYVIGGGQKPIGNHNQYNTEENVILCSSSGAYSGFISKYNKKVWKSDCFSIIPNTLLLNNNYLYYYLKNIQEDIYKLQKGNAQPHVYSSDLENIEIPIPSLEDQEETVKYQDLISNKIEEENKHIELLNNIIQNIMYQLK